MLDFGGLHILLMKDFLHQLRLVVYPIIYIFSAGARFLPSTVNLCTFRMCCVVFLRFNSVTLSKSISETNHIKAA